MTLVVESGSGTNPSANTYISMVYADSYHTLRGNLGWVDGDDDAKASSLVRATDWVDERIWVGERLFETQPLEWPRDNVWNEKQTAPLVGIPSVVCRAVAEMAEVMRSGAFDASFTADSAGGITHVGAGSVQVSFAPRTQRSLALLPAVIAVANMLRYLSLGTGSIPVVRS